MSEQYWKERAEQLENTLLSLEHRVRTLANRWGSVAEELESLGMGTDKEAEILRGFEARLRGILTLLHMTTDLPETTYELLESDDRGSKHE